MMITPPSGEQLMQWRAALMAWGLVATLVADLEDAR